MGAGGGQLGAGIASVVGGIVCCCIPPAAAAGATLIGAGAGMIANGAVTMKNEDAMKKAEVKAEQEADRQKRLGFDNALKGMVQGATTTRAAIKNEEKRYEALTKNGTDDNRYKVRTEARQQAFMGKPVGSGSEKYS